MSATTEAESHLAPPGPWRAPTRERLLLANVLVVAVCALLYELLCGTLASYLLGDAVLQFSLVLGIYLFAMGAGAWISKSLEARAASRYVYAELLLALVGGLSVPGLLLAVSAHVPLRPTLYAVVLLVGLLVGVELPLLVRILRRQGRVTAAGEDRREAASPASRGDDLASGRFGDLVARVLAYDYVGALGASLLFPLVLVPRLGLVRTSIVAGMVNALVAVSATYVVTVERPRLIRVGGGFLLLVLAIAFVQGETWVASATD